MIEILDKINNTYWKVYSLEFAIHPLNGQVTNIGDMEKEYIGLGKVITGIIFKKDGSTLVLYGKKDEWIWYVLSIIRLC